MLKTIIILPDGTEIASGNKAVNAIQKSTITECVNSGEDLTIGSVCSNAFEASIFTPNGAFSIDAGTEITVEKENEKGNRTRQGIFVLEKPTRPSANMMKIIGYDRISKLDKDLSSWLLGLTGWPYSLSTFAQMVCNACGLEYQATDIPNGEFPVRKFTRQSVTGRQIMQWLGEICGSFCRANKEGKIEFAWYSATGVKVTSAGENYYFQNGLTFEDYAVAAVDAVQIRLADSADGALFPSNEAAVNSYIITGNPILNSKVSQELVSYLNAIKNRLAAVSYTPCKVELPATPNIHAGDILTITDKNGKQITVYVMAKTQTGQKDTLECTGSRDRNSSAAANHQSNKDAAASIEANATADAKSYTDAENEKLNQLELLKRLTKEWVDDAIYLTEDGRLAINASAILTGLLASKDGKIVIDLSSDGVGPVFNTGISTNGITVRGDAEGLPALFKVKLDYYDGVPSVCILVYNAAGQIVAQLNETFDSSGKKSVGTTMSIRSPDQNNHIWMSAANDETTISFLSLKDASSIEIKRSGDDLYIGGMKIDWRSNGDGTYTMIGS